MAPNHRIAGSSLVGFIVRCPLNQDDHLGFIEVHGEVHDAWFEAFRAWKLGQAGRNNGVLVLVFPDDRKIRLQIGSGLEKGLPDKVCEEIIATDMAPNFRKGDYDRAVAAALNSLMNATREGSV
jgi:uncharacterized membrane protein YgcG